MTSGPRLPAWQSSGLDVIVVGAGLMGAATAWSLARRGRSVLLVEQFGPAHDRGSSHGSARIVRRAYADALYTRLTGQAFELWRELEAQSGAPILRMLGGIDHGSSPEVDAIDRQLDAQGVSHELLTTAEAEDRWPGMRFAGNVVFHPQAGTIDAALAVESFVSAAVRCGAQVLSEAQVVALHPAADRAEIELANGRRAAARVIVVAAGAWLGPLLQGLVALPPLRVTQEQIFHFARRDPAAAPWPSVIHERGGAVYHLAGGRDGGPHEDRKVAEHGGGTATTATQRTGEVDPAARARVVDYVRRWLPGLEPSPGREATCLYTATPSADFLLDRVDSLVVCSPCSGHGAKFAPLIGELAADLVTSPDGAPIPSRFRLAAHR